MTKKIFCKVIRSVTLDKINNAPAMAKLSEKKTSTFSSISISDNQAEVSNNSLYYTSRGFTPPVFVDNIEPTGWLLDCYA